MIEQCGFKKASQPAMKGVSAAQLVRAIQGLNTKGVENIIGVGVISKPFECHSPIHRIVGYKYALDDYSVIGRSLSGVRKSLFFYQKCAFLVAV